MQSKFKIINDFTAINPVRVEDIVTPQSIEELQNILRTHDGPVSIGGGRFSMGGQTASDGALFIDMKKLSGITAFDPAAKEVTLLGGTTWETLQRHIDPENLSVAIMQSYADFTVGGALGVNCHGRYVGAGPVISAVKQIKVVTADGNIVTASPSENSDLFYGAIGGYGALGVIAEVTLKLADNDKIERSNISMPLSVYKDYFAKNIRDDKNVVFHNADISMRTLDTVTAVSWRKTDKPLTDERRFNPHGRNYASQISLFFLTELPLIGHWIREKIIDPVRFMKTPVVRRNHEASLKVATLKPDIQATATYVLQEYFVPVAQFDIFAEKMRDVLKKHKNAYVLNISIRHAHKDPGSVMAWAREEVFAFVIYYKQGVTQGAKRDVGVWTRDLIDAAIDCGGTYYLPYQLHATREQFAKAYPDAEKFFTLKDKYDPNNKFRNRLWDSYGPHPVAPAPRPIMWEDTRAATLFSALRDKFMRAIKKDAVLPTEKPLKLPGSKP